jgi:carbonic anhydrase
MLDNLLENNRAWAQRISSEDPEFFAKLSRQQEPEYLWIGCSDSRVPANQITGLLPGEVFVHRNIANLVVHTDLNCLSVVQYAVDVLRVKHVIVCGHYGCGGVLAALRDDRVGLVDNWLQNVRDVKQKHRTMLGALPDRDAQHNLLCELNVIEQVLNLSRTTVIQDVWRRGQALVIHGWIYGIDNGILRDLGMRVSGDSELLERYELAIAARVVNPPG